MPPPLAHPPSDRRFLGWLGVVTVLLIPLSFVAAPYPRELVLQHLPTLAILGLWSWAVRRGWLSPPSLLCVLAFVWLHLLGARWIYSFVPYDEWSEALTGRTISAWFGWRRNHYDRFVHLAFGVLAVAPAAELLRERAGVRARFAAPLAVVVVLACGAAYEVLEWLLAVALSPEQAEAYNGQQGDQWDAQKDQALAWLGATLAATIRLAARRGVDSGREEGK